LTLGCIVFGKDTRPGRSLLLPGVVKCVSSFTEERFMFSFHEKTQRRIGLAGFGVFCVVPTIAVLAWIASLYLPSHRRSIERSFSHLLGMDVRVEAVRHPKPGLTALEDVEIRTAESGEVILRSKAVEVFSQWDGTTVLSAARVTAEAKHYPAVEELFKRLLTRRIKPDAFQVRVNVGELNVRLAEKTRPTLLDVRGIIASEPEESQTHWNFQLDDESSEEPIRLSFRRKRGDGPVTTIMGVHTGEAEISSELLGLGLPWMRVFGAAEFSGKIQTESHGGGTETQLHGDWRDVEVESLVDDRESAEITGLADLKVSYARFYNGRLAQATGVLRLGAGSVERRLLELVGVYYNLECRPAEENEPTRLPFSWVEADFRLENGMLALKGRSGNVLMGGPRGNPLLQLRNPTVDLDAFRFPGMIPVVEVEGVMQRR